MPKVTIEKYEDEGQGFKTGDILEYDDGTLLLVTSDGNSNSVYGAEVYTKEPKEYLAMGCFDATKASKFRGKIIVEQE